MAIRGVSLLDMDFSKEFPFEFAVQSYGCTKLNVMYTNDPDSVKPASPSSSSTYRTRKHKVAGLDLVPIYSSGPADRRRPGMCAGRGSHLPLL